MPIPRETFTLIEMESKPQSQNYSAVPQNVHDHPVPDAESTTSAHTESKSGAIPVDLEEQSSFKTPHRPILLHPFTGWALVTLFILLCAVLVAITAYSHKKNGLFTISPDHNNRNAALRLLWSSGPTLTMTIITSAVLYPMAFALYLIAPYVELEKGRARAEHSIMANYAIHGMRERLKISIRNRKWGLATLAVAALLANLVDTAASGLIESQNIIINSALPVQVTSLLGIEPSTDGTDDGSGNHIFLSSDQYLAAALFAGGQQLYQPSPIPFSYYGQKENWSITPLALPALATHGLVAGQNSSAVTNLTVVTNGINTMANCKMANITFGSNATVTATVDQCSSDFPVSTDTAYPRWHFANSTQCNKTPKADFAFNTFVYGVYEPSGYAARDPSQFAFIFCRPTISVAKVSATLSVAPNGAIGAMITPPLILESFPIGSNSSDPDIANFLGPPLNGLAINGYDIAEPANISVTSRVARVNVTQSILFEGIYGNLLDHMGDNDAGLPVNWFNDTQRVKLSGIVADFYQGYLNAFSPSVYYNSKANNTSVVGSLAAPVPRAVVSSLHAIALGVLLLVISGLLAVTLLVQPRPSREGHALRMYVCTISHHVMATTDHLHEIIKPLAGMEEEEMIKSLWARRFSFQAGTGQIVWEDAHDTISS